MLINKIEIMRLCYITFIFFNVIGAINSQVESELRNDFFAIYENNSFDKAFVKLFGNGNRGTLQFFNGGYNLVGWFDTNTENSGYMGVRSNTGSMTATLNSILGYPNHGILNVYGGDSERILAQLYASTDVSGGLLTFGPNSRNTYTAHLSGTPDHGYMGVYDGADVVKAGLYVDAMGQGTVFADVKNFVSAHPTDPSKEIVYASLEGPEAAAYLRGTATLKQGKSSISFPEHFRAIGNTKDMTVQVTPHSASTYGLAVTSKSDQGFEVMELMGGQGSFTFDWEVKTRRIGFEAYQPVRKKSDRIPALQKGTVQQAIGLPVMEVKDRESEQKNSF